MAENTPACPTRKPLKWGGDISDLFSKLIIRPPLENLTY